MKMSTAPLVFLLLVLLPVDEVLKAESGLKGEDCADKLSWIVSRLIQWMDEAGADESWD